MTKRNFETLELGKFYRDGQEPPLVSKIVGYDSSDNTFVNANGNWYNPDGTFFGGDNGYDGEWDLIELVEQPTEESAIHPAPTAFTADEIQADSILRFFHYAHLPEVLQPRSKPFADLARHVIDTTPRNTERSVVLRKLLEAKDAAVRACVE